MGLFCPICMTDGVARVLELSGSGPLVKETIERLTTRDVSKLWQGAMFLTERQGGSDVGANRVTAREEKGRWLLNGDKWFCSNVGAEAILALARMPGGPSGTQGLGLFLVLRHRPEGNGRTVVIHRLKEKLGVRSMATGEVTFAETEATLLGGVGEGFKQMAEMLNLSRLYNAVGSVAAMRRATLEALAYGAERRAFGQSLWSPPLWRSTMADVVAETLGAFGLAFEAVRALDRADSGDGEARRLARILIPMAKILCGKLAVQIVSEAMEAIGGNAYIEESILPRLLRDCQVLPIWEGTSNILSLDVLRANRRERAHESFFARVREAVETARPAPALAAHAGEVQERLEKDARYLERLEAQSPEDQQRGARQWVEAAGRTMTLALLLEAASHEPLRAAAVAAFRRLAVRPYATMSAMSLEAAELADTEEELLRAGFSPKESGRFSRDSAVGLTGPGRPKPDDRSVVGLSAADPPHGSGTLAVRGGWARARTARSGPPPREGAPPGSLRQAPPEEGPRAPVGVSGSETSSTVQDARASEGIPRVALTAITMRRASAGERPLTTILPKASRT